MKKRREATKFLIILIIALFLNGCGSSATNSRNNHSGSEESYYFTHIMRLTNSQYQSKAPSLVWNGSEYAIAWIDNKEGTTEIYFSRFTENGKQIGSEICLTNKNYENSLKAPILVWTGNEYAVLWCGDIKDFFGGMQLYFVRITTDGQKVGNEQCIASPSNGYIFYFDVIWTGSRYGIVWTDSDAYIKLTQLDFQGNKIGDEITVNAWNQIPIAPFKNPAITWTGMEYGIFWSGEKIYFARIDGVGNIVESPVSITNSPSNSELFDVLWTGTEYGLVWKSDGNSLSFTRFDNDGDQIGTNIELNDYTYNLPDSPSLVWNNNEFGTVWYNHSAFSDQLMLARISKYGEKIECKPIIDPIYRNGSPSLVWTGSKYAIAYLKEVITNGMYNDEIFLADAAKSLPPTPTPTSPLPTPGPPQTILWQDDGTGFIQFYTNEVSNYNKRFIGLLDGQINSIDSIEIQLKKQSGCSGCKFGLVLFFQDINHYNYIGINNYGYRLACGIDGLNESSSGSQLLLDDDFNGLFTMRVVYKNLANPDYELYMNNVFDGCLPQLMNCPSGQIGFFVDVDEERFENFPRFPVDVRFKINSIQSNTRNIKNNTGLSNRINTLLWQPLSENQFHKP